MKPRVVILGGGFAGLSCALSLSASVFDVVLVDRKPHFEFLPALHELLSGLKRPEALRLSLKSVLGSQGHRFRRAEVRGIDPEACRVQLARGSLEYDYLVLALGAADADFGVEGVRENAMGFKSVSQCRAIGQRLAQLHRSDQKARVVIVGGGLEGVEALGEILRIYRDGHIDFSLIDAGAGLLPTADLQIGKHLETYCRDYGVSLLFNTRVSRITPKTVLLDSGQRLRSALTIWTGGAVPQPLYRESGLTAGLSWVPATNRLLHADHDTIYLAGDAAGCDPAIEKQAYHAIDMGMHCGRDIRRRDCGLRARPFRPANKPKLVSFGDLDTLLIAGDNAIAGPGLAALKEAVYQSVMLQMDQRDALSRTRELMRRGEDALQRVKWPKARLSSLPSAVRIQRIV